RGCLLLSPLSAFKVLRIWYTCAPRAFNTSPLFNNCKSMLVLSSHSFRKKDLLLSLEELHIFSCPLLEEGCSRGKGREWFKISRIPYVEIKHKVVIPRELD
ncbi:hypothetical protein Goklo_024368, partial [Gossypium klotzschianum]|nr:hypothetical protein [Gossypium klotzschianum]